MNGGAPPHPVPIRRPAAAAESRQEMRVKAGPSFVMRPSRYSIAAVLLLVSLVIPMPVPAEPQANSPAGERESPTISADTAWSGEIVLRQNLVVGPGAALTVAPGTTVRVEPGKRIGITVLGRLRVEGSANAPVRFVPAAAGGDRAAWEGIRLGPGGAGEQVLAGFRIEGAREGVSLGDAAARFRGGVFAGCAAGVVVNQKASAVLDNCLFEGNDAGTIVSLGGRADFTGCRFEDIRNQGIVADKGAAVRASSCLFSRGKTGVLSLTNAPCVFDGCRFLSLESGIVARQMGGESAVTRCLFENDGTGLSAVQFCALVIADSVFRGNKTGIAVREFSTPTIVHNLFERNGEAVNLFRKSHARVERNVFSNNRNAMVINYSSYPLVQGNNFDRNDMSVRLEKFQSGDWEERAGSPALTAGEAGRRGSRAMPAGVQPAAFPKRISARGNWWGPDADRDPARGTLGKIWDGTKFGPVKYEGFGDAEYRIDVVDFSGEEASPVKDAGPRAGKTTGAGG